MGDDPSRRGVAEALHEWRAADRAAAAAQDAERIAAEVAKRATSLSDLAASTAQDVEAAEDAARVAMDAVQTAAEHARELAAESKDNAETALEAEASRDLQVKGAMHALEEARNEYQDAVNTARTKPAEAGE